MDIVCKLMLKQQTCLSILTNLNIIIMPRQVIYA
jgi:hypothetical protein